MVDHDLLKVACVGVAGGVIGAFIGASLAQCKWLCVACVRVCACIERIGIHFQRSLSVLVCCILFGTAAAPPARKPKAKCKVVKTANASPAGGHYSQAIVNGMLLRTEVTSPEEMGSIGSSVLLASQSLSETS